MGQFAVVGAMIVVAILVVAGIAIVTRLREQRRTESLRNVASELSFEFREADESFLARLAEFQLFSQGRARKMTNIMHGESSNVEVNIFDYCYTTGSGKNSHTHHQTGIGFRSARLSLPKFELKPERWYHKIGSMLGYQDIDFADYPGFSQQYLLRGENEQAVRELFVASVIEYLEMNTGIFVEGSGDRLIVYRAGKRARPEEVKDFLADGFGVYSALTEVC